MKILIINTGGTISCVGEPLKPMSAAQFAEACARIMTPILREKFPETEFVYEKDLAFPNQKTVLWTAQTCNRQIGAGLPHAF